MINKLAQEIFENAKSKGFYDNGAATNIGERLMLIVTEVAEVCEADRKDRYTLIDDVERTLDIEDDKTFQLRFNLTIKDNFEDELADIMIRVMDFAAFKNIDLEARIEAKMRYNSLREHKHGKKY